MSATQKDFYRILGVIDSAESGVIRAAYKALMMIYHPDRCNGEKAQAIRKAKEINEAYAVLADQDKRKKYDAERLNRPRKPWSKSDDELKEILIESEAILRILDELE